MTGFRGNIKVLGWHGAGRADAATVAAARAALRDALGGDADDLSLRVHDGVVTIRGEVDRMDDIHAFDAIVRAVPGVADVDNLLRLRVARRLRAQVLSA